MGCEAGVDDGSMGATGKVEEQPVADKSILKSWKENMKFWLKFSMKYVGFSFQSTLVGLVLEDQSETWVQELYWG